MANKKVWNPKTKKYEEPKKEEKHFLSKTSLIKTQFGSVIGKTRTRPYTKDGCSVCGKKLEHPKEWKKHMCLSCQIEEIEKEIQDAKRNRDGNA